MHHFNIIVIQKLNCVIIIYAVLVFRRQVRYPFILCNPCTTKLLGLELKTIPANSHKFGVNVVLLKCLAYTVGLPPIHSLSRMHLIYLADRFATRFQITCVCQGIHNIMIFIATTHFHSLAHSTCTFYSQNIELELMHRQIMDLHLKYHGQIQGDRLSVCEIGAPLEYLWDSDHTY